MKKLLIFLIIGLLCINFATATCTVNIARTSVFKGETITASMSCDATNERNQAYTLNWTNGTGVISAGNILLETDIGTTPGTTGQIFTQTYTVPYSWGNGTIVNASLYGTNLEGSDWLNVSSAGVNDLVISNISVGGKWLGLTSSAIAYVTDENGKKISGGYCHVHVLSQDQTQSLINVEDVPVDGIMYVTGPTPYDSFKEAQDYIVDIHCMCGTNNTPSVCIDQSGNVVTNSVGSAQYGFTLNQWISFTDNMTIVNENMSHANGNNIFYAGYGEKVYWLSNKTNNYKSNLIDNVENFFVNSVTGLTFPAEKSSFSIKNNETVSRLRALEIPASIPTGTYYIRQYHNIWYDGLEVAQYILQTNNFNVTGTNDTFVINNIRTDKDFYYTGESLNVCLNISSYYSKRIEYKIYYRFRCGTLTNPSTAFLLGDDSEERAINPYSLNQLKCWQFFIPFNEVTQYKDKQSCQSFVTVESPFINTYDHKLSYTNSTQYFYVTDYGMYPQYVKDPSYPMVRLNPDWRRFDDVIDNVTRSYYRAKINITWLNETSIDPTDLITNNSWDVYTLFSDNMPCSTEIYNYSVKYANGTVVDNSVENKALTWVDRNGEEQRSCAIGIENVNFADTGDDYFEVFVWYEDLNERQTEALESIANSSGNYEKSLSCTTPAYYSDGYVSCNFVATREKGGDKETYYRMKIQGFDSTLTKFNKLMYEGTQETFSKILPFPATLVDGITYTVEVATCYDGLGLQCDDIKTTATFTYNGGLRPTTGGGSSGGGDTSGAAGKEETKTVTQKVTTFANDNIAWIFGSMFLIIMLAQPKREENGKGKTIY